MRDPSSREIRATEPREVQLLGIGLGHAITPPVHRFVLQDLDIAWQFNSTECPIITTAVTTLRSPNLAGAVVTMPYKSEIMPHLDYLDPIAKTVGAVNVVYFDGDGRLCGSNTDWEGIVGALREEIGGQAVEQSGGSAVLIGAGGAARAAVFALTKSFGVREVYVVNRDDDEVDRLIADCSEPIGVKMVHVKSIEQAQAFPLPSLILSTVPDYEAVTRQEKDVRSILECFLARDGPKGVMLDMCYHPNRQTRNLKLGEARGWRTVQGTQVVGHQVEALWRFWIDDSRLKLLDRNGMWSVLKDLADKRP